MRKAIYSIFSLLLLAGCNSVEDSVFSAEEGQDFDVTACKIASTRVGYTPSGDNDVTLAWEETDAISIYAIAGSDVNKGTLQFDSYTGSDKANANFRGHFDRDVTAATTVYAYAQYPNVYNRRNAIVNDLHFQTGTLTGEGSATTHDVLFASAQYDPASSERLTLTFNRKMAIAKVSITLPDGVSATSVTSCNVGASGLYSDVQLNIQDATLQSGNEGTILIDPAGISANGQTITFYMAVYPGALKNMSVNLEINGTRYAADMGDVTIAAGQLLAISAKSVSQMAYDTMGTITDEQGNPVSGVVVTDGFSCVRTDADGLYGFNRNSGAQFVYYTIPADCEVPTHSSTVNTACFYKTLVAGVSQYNFTVKKLAGGKETNHVMIVLGDPQVTSTQTRYYADASDTEGSKTDLNRFADETMQDVAKTITALPAGTPVYGLTMGDDVQYYGGYLASLEESVRLKLGSTSMKLFSVIGNHDQDGQATYKQKWHESWGPSDYSFDRGDIHYVCFNNVYFYSGASYYNPGEPTASQMAWLEKDLELADKTKKVILSYHIPLTFGTGPLTGATSMGNGHYASTRLSAIVQLLKQFSGGYELWCGHTHFAVNNEITLNGESIYERSHAAACGDIWNSNINIDGVPNGYYVYDMNGTSIHNCYYKGTRWDKSKQMSLFWADTSFNGETYAADWSLSTGKGIIVANIFNADSKWSVTAIENGERTPMTRLQQTPNQDAFAVGYHKKYARSNSYNFFSKNNKYLKMLHWYYYTPKDANATITIEAIDPYGNKYTATSSDVVTEPFYNYAHYYAE